MDEFIEKIVRLLKAIEPHEADLPVAIHNAAVDVHIELKKLKEKFHALHQS